MIRVNDSMYEVTICVKRKYPPFGKHKFVMGHRGVYQDGEKSERFNFEYTKTGRETM